MQAKTLVPLALVGVTGLGAWFYLSDGNESRANAATTEVEEPVIAKEVETEPETTPVETEPAKLAEAPEEKDKWAKVLDDWEPPKRDENVTKVGQKPKWDPNNHNIQEFLAAHPRPSKEVQEQQAGEKLMRMVHEGARELDGLTAEERRLHDQAVEMQQIRDRKARRQAARSGAQQAQREPARDPRRNR